MELTLRLAEIGDSALLLAWRNDPATRAASRSTAEVPATEHQSWLVATLASPSRHLLVAEVDGRPIGQVRFDHESRGAWEISVSLSPETRGRRLAAATIAAGVRWLWSREPGARHVQARVRPENAASAAAFGRAGFSPAGAAEGMTLLVSARP